LLFNTGWNKQVFLLNPEKKLAQICLVVFEKNAKNAPLIRKMTSPSRRLGYSNYQLKNCKQVKEQFQELGSHGFRKSKTGL